MHRQLAAKELNDLRDRSKRCIIAFDRRFDATAAVPVQANGPSVWMNEPADRTADAFVSTNAPAVRTNAAFVPSTAAPVRTAGAADETAEAFVSTDGLVMWTNTPAIRTRAAAVASRRSAKMAATTADGSTTSATASKRTCDIQASVRRYSHAMSKRWRVDLAVVVGASLVCVVCYLTFRGDRFERLMFDRASAGFTTFDFATEAPFDWDQLAVFSSYETQVDAERTLGSECAGFGDEVDEGKLRVLFIRGRTVAYRFDASDVRLHFDVQTFPAFFRRANSLFKLDVSAGTVTLTPTTRPTTRPFDVP